MLADEDRRHGRGHQRRRAARDRIDLAEIAGAIALDQAGEIEQVDDDRGDQPGPRGKLRPAGERNDRQRDDAAAPIAISTVVASGSSVRLMLAFQPAWQAAANSTATKTKGSTSARPSRSPPRSASMPVVVEHRLQQHLRALGALLLGGKLRLVVADAAAARHEDHRGRRDARNIGRVVARARDDVARGIAGQLRRAADRRDAIRIEPHRAADPRSAARRTSGRAARRPPAARRERPLPSHRARAPSGMAQVDHEEHLARHDVGRVRPVLDPPDGGDARRMLRGRSASTASISRAAPSSAFLRRCIGVAPVCASWPVTVTSYQRIACTPVTTPMSLPFGLQDRPLLDVQFEERRQRMLAAALGRRDSRSRRAPRRRSCRRGPCALAPSPSSIALANTPDATIAGAKREPSSLVQFTTSIGA